MDKLEFAKSVPIGVVIESETQLKLNSKNFLSECVFCGSGKNGKKNTPGLSIDTKSNIFKCFACSKSGNPIEFIKYFKNFDNKQSVRYLCDKYSNFSGLESKKAIEPKPDIKKMLFAISKNNLEKATSYLKQRGINIELLKPETYFYDTLENAIVFIDSDSHLINKRLIEPLKSQSKSTFAKGSKISNNIYDKCFDPESDKVYITEGVINAFSLLPESSISIFTTSNRINDISKLSKYCSNKNIIIAFDNDKSGNECAEYYSDFILHSEINILSLKRLVFNENQDANDLLIENKISDFIQDKTHFITIIDHEAGEKELLSPLPMNSEDFDLDIKNNQYSIQDGCYWVRESYNKKQIDRKVSNFTMKILYHFVDGTQNTKRLILIQRYTGELNAIEVLSSDMKTEAFETILKSYSCSFLGNSFQLKSIFVHLMDEQLNANCINILGYNYKYDIYSFSDSIINKNNKLIIVNELGIINDSENTYYLPAWAESNLLNKHFDNERIFKYNQGVIDFKTWADLIYKAYDINGGIGICFLIMAIFRDIVFKEINFFPYLYLYGQPGVGKTSYIDFILRLFGNKDVGVSLKNSTIKGIARTCSQRTNSIIFLKEYDNSIEKEIIAFFKNAYDGASYTVAQKSNDNKTDSYVIESGVIIDSNYLPTAESAMFDRMIVLTFDKNTFSKEKTEAYAQLIIESDKGFGQITKEILSYREYFKDNFKKEFLYVYNQLKNNAFSYSDIEISKLPERNLKHISFLLVPFKILFNKLSFPFTFEDIVNKTLEYAIEKNDLLEELNDINIFWDAINYERSQGGSTRIKTNEQYQLNHSERILYLKVKEVYPYYSEYCNKNNVNQIDYSSLLSLLTSSSYDFIPNTQKGRGKAYTKKDFGSCYRFSFVLGHENKNILIKNKEIDL
ncbi:MAG: hypothetical protein CVU05_02695 [Bacteroidetes bacterium HGW-Bacteroidetes-21]|jgi:hypothetical protein|nr:MAG: hypothetical protein CVU05_02695 [Bacteroidetes bacterium HGW-Bacteroidetes-21]